MNYVALKGKITGYPKFAETWLVFFCTVCQAKLGAGVLQTLKSMGRLSGRAIIEIYPNDSSW